MVQCLRARTQVQILALLQNGCMTLDRLYNFSMPQHPPFKHGNKRSLSHEVGVKIK